MAGRIGADRTRAHADRSKLDDAATGRRPPEVILLMSDDRLEALRVKIRAVDHEFVKLIGRRRDLVIEIGEAKEALGLPVLDPPQEAEVVRRAVELARELEVDEELTRDVIWRIIASARDTQTGRTRWGPPLPRGQDATPPSGDE